MKKLLLLLIFILSNFVLFSQTSDDYCLKASEHIKIKDYKSAILEFNKAIDLNQENAWAYYCRGIAKNMLKDYRGAITDINKAIYYDPKSGHFYISRGIVKIKLNQLEDACLDFGKAGELGIDKAYEMINEYCK
jgi:tetratricopeptide (TPR) repeat protein